MTRITFDITMSLDGYVAGPNPSLEQPLGEGADHIHDWITRLGSWREAHGLEGGEPGPDDDVFEEAFGAVGAFVMGRGMYSMGSGPWQEDPKADGWWGDDPPFHAPVFVLTHHARDPLPMEGGTTFHFVTEGLEAALEQARAAAGGRDVGIAGGASVVQQALAAGLVDEFQIHVAPLVLGSGTSLFGDLGTRIDVECTRVLQSPFVTHMRYRVLRQGALTKTG
jgi:dihydrofolate reductase